MQTTLHEKPLAVTTETLQAGLVDLIDLELQSKQAHWNVHGPLFREIHLQLDELVGVAREYADTVAERCAALGGVPDGRATTVADARPLPSVSGGQLDDQAVIDDICVLLGDMITRMRDRIGVTGETDPVTQDVFITLTAQLEKQAWFFRSHRLPGHHGA
ncbi:DNA starvation/stationary phase protection protein [Streptomyces sp. A7024]|uniref:DNA starvation/stationary phase protection protein n=1 Tax=Streptomyces coryli TaxID=1128680 RepID=A0A6G4U5F5_9ACTN|nr:DNA starvation/stationary phase protection protein [Streptomyces coryli]NGN67469.1 DNA starvation/stationary phase protection protein [Streptomyces coryli]